MARHEIGLAVSTVIFALRPHPRTGASTLWLPLVRRVRDPFDGLWALPGGWVHGDEGLEDAAARTLDETTSLRPSYLEQLYAFGDVDRSPGDRVVSVVYWALVHADQTARTSEGQNVRWFVADELPPLAFDHNLIVEYALWRLRTKVEYSRIAHALLGPTFTLSELRQVHEAVLRRVIDPANFRRQIAASGSVVPTGEYSGGRHRPARLYRYDTSAPLVDVGPLASGRQAGRARQDVSAPSPGDESVVASAPHDRREP